MVKKITKHVRGAKGICGYCRKAFILDMLDQQALLNGGTIHCKYCRKVNRLDNVEEKKRLLGFKDKARPYRRRIKITYALFLIICAVIDCSLMLMPIFMPMSNKKLLIYMLPPIVIVGGLLLVLQAIKYYLTKDMVIQLDRYS